MEQSVAPSHSLPPTCLVGNKEWPPTLFISYLFGREQGVPPPPPHTHTLFVSYLFGREQGVAPHTLDLLHVW